MRTARQRVAQKSLRAGENDPLQVVPGKPRVGDDIRHKNGRDCHLFSRKTR